MRYTLEKDYTSLDVYQIGFSTGLICRRYCHVPFPSSQSPSSLDVYHFNWFRCIPCLWAGKMEIVNKSVQLVCVTRSVNAVHCSVEEKWTTSRFISCSTMIPLLMSQSDNTTSYIITSFGVWLFVCAIWIRFQVQRWWCMSHCQVQPTELSSYLVLQMKHRQPRASSRRSYWLDHHDKRIKISLRKDS